MACTKQAPVQPVASMPRLSYKDLSCPSCVCTLQVRLTREHLLAWRDAAAARAVRAQNQRVVEEAVAHRDTSHAFQTWLWLYRARELYGR